VGISVRKKPHPLFDPNFYLERYPDVERSGLDPLVHFLRFGGLEGRQPHPHFDSGFYLANNPDVVAEKLNPLVHFLEHGAEEGRLPHPDFDPASYLKANPDVAVAKVDPILHFAKHGAADERLTRPIFEMNPPPEFFLPVQDSSQRPVSNRPIDIIIPVYRGFAETKACIESVFSSTHTAHFRVVVVNDRSPEPELTEYLRHLSRDKKINLVENSQNLGFVRSVNAGMQASDHDVVLLNSDAVVFDGWLDRLAACAYTDERTGTVTPFSNNATICSYPVSCSDNKLPPAVDLAALDSTFSFVNCGRAVEIPTTVGFCMFIRRECLQETGLFDAEAFGLGYGEENDFCMRSAAKGWKHKLACDVFVYHAGKTSFGEASASAREQNAMRVLIGKHPKYHAIVHQHIGEDPANAYRIAVTAQRIRNSGKRVFLSITHASGGGTAQHLRELVQLTADEVIWLNLSPSPPDRLILECVRDGFQFSLPLTPSLEYAHLTTVVRACGVERVHIHHLLGHVLDVPRLVEDLGLPVDFTVHDYYAICPQITLSDEDGRYCGEPGQEGCNGCLLRRPPGGPLLDIASWRARHAWLVTKSNRVIAPTADTASRIKRHYPDACVIAAEHQDSQLSRIVVPKRLAENEHLRIVVLGTLAIHKGFKLLQDCAERVRRSQLPLEFILVGSVEVTPKSGPVAFSETGPYDVADLPTLLERVAPHVVWFPGKWPETFSYTLSTCLEMGLPVAAHDIGSFPERLGARPWTWVVPREWPAAEWIELFLRIRRENFSRGIGPHVPPRRPRALADFYREQYLGKSTEASAIRAKVRSRSDRSVTIAAALATDNHGQIQACGYVRVVQPLTHPAIADTFRLALTTPRHLATSESDVLLVQRTAIKDMDTAERLVQRCRARGSRLVFEIDDDLFDMGDHPESEQYAKVAEIAKWLAVSADAILTPSEILRQRMLALNPNIFVLPNYLDDRLWTPPSSTPPFKDGQVRFLYAGTMSHRDDLEFLGRVVQSLGRHRNAVQIDVIGASNGAPGDWFQVIQVPPPVAASYPRFVDWIRSQNRWHWGVAPLLDTHFNRAKSAVKFFEYAALGLPSICSEGPVYSPAVQHERTGILAANDPECWRRALERAVTDAELWQRLREKCQAAARENAISTNVETIKSVWEALTKGLSAKASAG
jgi:GT2 family glycosyltransferase/glycosyltransferase involved in cell wall biosynthesis